MVFNTSPIPEQWGIPVNLNPPQSMARQPNLAFESSGLCDTAGPGQRIIY